MPDSRLKIVIDALNLAKGQASEIEKELAGLEGQAKKTGGAMEALKKGKAIFTDLTGAVAGFAGTFKGALELGKAGAQLDMMETKFSKLADSIGSSGDMLSSRLNVAMQGTASRAAMVESAVTLMNLGLAKSESEVVRMSSVSQKLNWDMQILGLTIANESTMRLDALGLSIEDVTSRQKALVVQGMSTSAAFREAILQAGEAKAALLGLDGQTENNTKSFARFEAATTDIADALKRKLTPELAKAFEAGALLLTWNEKIEAAQKMHADQVALTSDSYEEYTAEIARARGVQDGYVDSMGNLIKTSGLGYGITEQLAVAHAALTREEWEHERVMAKLIQDAPLYADGHDRLAEAVKRTTGEIKIATVDLKAQETALTNLKTAIQGAVSNEYEAFIERQGDLKVRAGEVKTELDKLKTSHGAVVKEQDKNKMSANELALAQLRLKGAQQELSKATDPLKQAELRVEIEGLAAKIGSANQATTSYVDNSKRISEVKTEYDKINVEIEKNAQKHEEATKRIILGFLEQKLAVDGWTKDEITAYEKVSREFGLIDDTTWAVIGGVNDALKSLETGSMDDFLAKIAAIKNQSLGLASGSPLGPPTGGGGGKVESYQGGGIVPGPIGMPHFAIVHGGEQITPPSSTVNNYYQNERGGDTFIVNDVRAWAMIQAQRRLATVEARYG